MKKIVLLFLFILSLTIGAYAQTEWQWAKRLYGGENEFAQGIAVDPSGNVAITGHYFSEWLFCAPGIQLTNNDLLGSADAFVAKYDAAGNAAWAKNIGGGNNDGGVAVVMDASGNVYVAGKFYSGSLVLGTNTYINAGSGTSDIFLIKYNASGDLLWAKCFGDEEEESVYDMTLDQSGNILLTGQFESDELSFGTETLTNVSTMDMFLVKLNPQGDAIWATQAKGNSDTYPNDVAVDGNGNVYLLGSFTYSSITFGSSTITNNYSGTQDVFLVKYNSSGSSLWAQSGTGSHDNDDGGKAICIDENNNVYIVGSFGSQTITFGSITLTNESIWGTDDIFIVKYDAAGNETWGKRAGVSVVNDISYDNGKIIIIGEFEGDISFGNIDFFTNSGEFMYLAEYDASGNVVDANYYGTNSDNTYGTALIQQDGNIYVTGSFNGGISFDDVFLYDDNETDYHMYVAKYGSPASSVEEHGLIDLLIFPNPSQGEVEISFNTIHSQPIEIDVIDMYGKTVFHTVEKPDATKEIKINLSQLPAGMYTGFLKMEHEVVSKKICVVK